MASGLRPTRQDIEALCDRFMDAWRRHDLDAAMAMVAEDGVYEDLAGRVHTGKLAIRDAFLPEFRGDFGDIQFDREQTVVDEESATAILLWKCTFELNGTPRAWRGLDVLTFRGDELVRKLTYGKTARPALTST